MRLQRGVLAAGLIGLASLLSASCSQTMNKVLSPPVTWTATPVYNYSHLSAQSLKVWIAPATWGTNEDWVRLSAHVEVGNGATVAQVTIVASGPRPGDSGSTPQPTVVLAVNTPVPGTSLTSAHGSFYSLVNLSSIPTPTPSGPILNVNQHDVYRFDVAPIAGQVFGYIPLQSIFANESPTPQTEIRGVLDVPQPNCTCAPNALISSFSVPSNVTAIGGMVTIGWSCVQDAIFYLVRPIRTLPSASDPGWTLAVQGDANCGQGPYSYSFPAVTGDRFTVTVLATDMRWEMFFSGRDPLDISDVSTATFYIAVL